MENTQVNENVETETTEETQVETQQETKVVEAPKPDKNQLLREMSKEYGVNLFDAEGITKFKEFQESQKTEQEKLQEKLNTYIEQENTYKSQLEQKEAQIAALKLNLPEENLQDALILAKNYMEEGQSISDGLAKVKEKYPALFDGAKGTKTTVQVGTQMTDMEQANNSELDPALARYLSKKK